MTSVVMKLIEFFITKKSIYLFSSNLNETIQSETNNGLQFLFSVHNKSE